MVARYESFVDLYSASFADFRRRVGENPRREKKSCARRQPSFSLHDKQSKNAQWAVTRIALDTSPRPHEITKQGYGFTSADYSEGESFNLKIQILYTQCILLDKFTPWLDNVAH